MDGELNCQFYDNKPYKLITMPLTASMYCRFPSNWKQRCHIPPSQWLPGIPKQLTGTICGRDDHKPTCNCRRWRKALFQLTSLITSQLCGAVWQASVWLSLRVRLCVWVLCVRKQLFIARVRIQKTQQDNKWGRGAKRYFSQGLIIGMKSVQQLNHEAGSHRRLFFWWCSVRHFPGFISQPEPELLRLPLIVAHSPIETCHFSPPVTPGGPEMWMSYALWWTGPCFSPSVNWDSSSNPA